MNGESGSDLAYEPLDLTAWCSIGVDVYDPSRYGSGGTWLNPSDGADPLVGSCLLRGIPFQIGSADEDPNALRYLDFLDPTAETLHIPVSRRAERIIFAHAVLRTAMWTDGEPPGATLANYVFEWEDGGEHSVAIRERFEIGHFPQPWGNQPFLAVPDRHDGVEPRDGGPWHRVGYRLTEVTMATTQAYHLWSWVNPRPHVPIAAIRIEPVRHTFVVAGITLSHVDEEPLRLPPRVPITIKPGVDASTGQAFELSIDRGVATYVSPTSPTDGDRLESGGWGAMHTTSSATQYAFVSAVPSATLTLTQGTDLEVKTRWADIQTSQWESRLALVEVKPPNKNWVHVTIRDQAGRQVPCRVAFASADGIPFAPHGHPRHAQSGLRAWNLDVGGDVVLGDVTYAYVDGHCQGWLPRGPILVDIGRGFEYEPFTTWVEIESGQRSLDLTIDRWIDMRSDGWHSGDTHVHFLSPDGALTEAQGEDLAVVNLLQAQWGHLFTNVEDFDGRSRTSEDGQTVVWVSQENRQHVLGHLNLLGLTEPVMPMSSDGPSEAELGGGLDVTTSRWADAAHEQGGAVIVAHMPKPNGETAVLVATGRADGMEMIDFNHFEHLEYYRYLNGGYRLPLVAGTDKMEATIPVGLYRTYAHLENEFSYRHWLEAVKSGRTFITSGPMLRFEVDGVSPGETLRRPPGARVSVHARVESIFPVHSLQVVQGGEVVAETEVAQGSRSIKVEEEVTVSSHGWLAARCAGPGHTPAIHHMDHDRRPVMAHTSPVYIETGSHSSSALASTRYLLTLVEGGLSYLRGAIHHPTGTVTYQHGRDDHQVYLEEPFLEAGDELARRIRFLEGST